MPPRNPAQQLYDVPAQALILDLLKQFKRLLHERQIERSSQQLEALATAAAAHKPLPDGTEALVATLKTLVAESEAVLHERFGLSFAQSLATDMSSIGGWETTAEFLDVANHKSNAELRISAGSALLLFLGEPRYVAHLFTVLEADGGLDDVDAMIAKRALAHHSRIALDTENWLAAVRAHYALD